MSDKLTISVEKLENFECVKQNLDKIIFNIVQVEKMVPKLEVSFTKNSLLNLKQNIRYLKKVVWMMETILKKLKTNPSLKTEEVFLFYSLTALKGKKCEKQMGKLERFPILGNSQRDSVLLSPEQYLPKFLEFVADFKKHVS